MALFFSSIDLTLYLLPRLKQNKTILLLIIFSLPEVLFSQVQFSFAATCTVTVTIKKELGETIVELTQENIPLDESSKVKYHLGCMEGWTFFLANLKSILEGGIDLRNKNVKLSQLVNA